MQHLVPTSQLNKPQGSSSPDNASISTTEGGAQPPATTSTDGKPHVGRRGMHCATGAFWNDKTDGMWSYKYDGEGKGLDIVIMIVWIQV